MTRNDRSCRPEVFGKKGLLRNFAKFTGKHLRQSIFLNKVLGLATLFKSRQVFPVKFPKI